MFLFFRGLQEIIIANIQKINDLKIIFVDDCIKGVFENLKLLHDFFIELLWFLSSNMRSFNSIIWMMKSFFCFFFRRDKSRVYIENCPLTTKYSLPLITYSSLRRDKSRLYHSQLTTVNS